MNEQFKVTEKQSTDHYYRGCDFIVSSRVRDAEGHWLEWGVVYEGRHLSIVQSLISKPGLLKL